MDQMNEDEMCVLQDYNERTVKLYIPVIVYLFTVCVLGSIGNMVSLYIYARHYERSNARSFFVFLTGTELFSSAIVMPVEIYILFKNYTMFENELCQTISFLNVVQVELSTTVLVLIAVDRYRKVCNPFSWQVTQRAANIMLVSFVGFACIVAGPCIDMYKTQIMTLHFDPPYETYCPLTDGQLVYNITLFECTVSSDDKYTIYQTVYSGYWLFVSISFTVALALMYWRILVHIRRQNVKLGRLVSRRNTQTSTKVHVSEVKNDILSDVKSDRTSANNDEHTSSSMKRVTWSDKTNTTKQEADDKGRYAKETQYSTGIGGKSNGNTVVNEPEVRPQSVERDGCSDSGVDNMSGVIRISVSQFEEAQTEDKPNVKDTVDNDADPCKSAPSAKDVIANSTNADEQLDKETKNKDELFVMSQNNFNKSEPNTSSSDTSVGFQSTTKAKSTPESKANKEEDPVKETASSNESKGLSKLEKNKTEKKRKVSEQTVKSAPKASREELQARSRTRKVTLTMFIVTLSTFICFTPYFVIEFSRASNPNYLETLSDAEQVIWAYCTRSYYLKSILNPLVYGIFDSRFNAALRKIIGHFKFWS